LARKNFVLDTNVLLHDPRSIYMFDDNTVIIPIYVIEELDMFKKDMSELGRNARQIARYLDEHRAEGGLAEGVPMPNGGLLKVSFVEHDLPKSMADGQLMDNRILAVAIETRLRDPQSETVFITKDTNLRIRADALGLIAEDFEPERVEISDLYTGISERLVSAETINSLYKPGAQVSVPDLDILAHLLLQRHQFDVNQRFQLMRMIFGGHTHEHDHHRVGLNQDFMAAYLDRAGFTQLQRVSRHALFSDTSETVVAGTPISLNLNAFKPATAAASI
jgi:predicted ribonuclease YlaK